LPSEQEKAGLVPPLANWRVPLMFTKVRPPSFRYTFPPTPSPLPTLRSTSCATTDILQRADTLNINFSRYTDPLVKANLKNIIITLNFLQNKFYVCYQKLLVLVNSGLVST
jgi:hypothetical protein